MWGRAAKVMCKVFRVSNHMVGGLAVLLVVGVTGGIANAQELMPPEADLIVNQGPTLGVLHLPVGPSVQGGAVPLDHIEGNLRQRVYVLAKPHHADSATPLLNQVRILRAQLAAHGFSIVLDCDQNSCGGFDFRAQVQVLPAPNMYVNLSNFYAISATNDGGAVFLLLSRSDEAQFLQVLSVATSTETDLQPPSDVVDNGEQAFVPTDQDFMTELLNAGHVVLTGLSFASGAADLAAGDHAELRSLAMFLIKSPTARVALVGHTDASGTLASNQNLSKNRANSARQYLIDTLGVAPEQVTAEGVWFLAPLMPVDQPENAAKNRRVEAVLLSR
jgi:OOP family OmpA-OmpF porin